MLSWKPLVVLTAISGLAIFLFKSDYVSLQTAATPTVFADVLDETIGRARAATIGDMVFSASYGTLGLLAFLALDPGFLGKLGAGLAVAAALADEVENTFVMANIAHVETLKQGAVDGMLLAGTIKYALIGAAFLVLLVALLRRSQAHRKA
ncbi:MAG: hypothetical protein ABIR57_02325 [Aeromicrobium sp.]